MVMSGRGVSKAEMPVLGGALGGDGGGGMIDSGASEEMGEFLLVATLKLPFVSGTLGLRLESQSKTV